MVVGSASGAEYVSDELARCFYGSQQELRSCETLLFSWDTPGV